MAKDGFLLWLDATIRAVIDDNEENDYRTTWYDGNERSGSDVLAVLKTVRNHYLKGKK
jgi:hypothetical protein